MNQNLKDKIGKAIHTTLKRAMERGGKVDFIDVTERILDAVELIHDMAYEDSGVASLPPDLNTTSAVDWQQIQEADKSEKSHFLSAPPPSPKGLTQIPPADPSAKTRVISMPGDPDFDKAVQAKGLDAGNLGTIKSRRRPISRPASNSPQKQYWTEADLIAEVNSNTPDEIPFFIERADGSQFKIVAKKNVINQQGLGNVMLTYRDPRVGDGGNISLTAQYPFSLYEEEISIDKAMESIASQLSGLYRDRSQGVADPVAVGPEPNLADYRRTGLSAGSEEFHIQRDSQGQAVNIQNPKDQILSTLRRDNDRMAPTGRRFESK